jgi:hypothetical protein
MVVLPAPGIPENDDHAHGSTRPVIALGQRHYQW